MAYSLKQTVGLVLILVGIAPVASQERLSATDPEAYALYGLLLPQVWNNRTKDPILLQRETETSHYGCDEPRAPNRGWQSAVESFQRQNKHVQLLRATLLPKDLRYRFISRSEIEADDARLAVKYPGGWQRRPESLEFAAVSGVGFNGDKSKAILYLRLRGSGQMLFMEKLQGEWVRIYSPCSWAA